MNPIHKTHAKVQKHFTNPTHNMHLTCDFGEEEEDDDDDDDQGDGDDDGGDGQQLPWESNL